MLFRRILGDRTGRVVRLCLAVAWLGSSIAYAQRYEVTPLVGYRLGGTAELEQAGLPNFKVHLVDSINFGVAGGVHFDAGDECEGCNLIEFRWLRQDTHFTPKNNPLLAVTPSSLLSFRPAVVLDHYLADFTHEFNVPDFPYVRPFVTFTLGASYLSAPASATTRFVFGFGSGVKIFPKHNWGVRIQAEYLPTVLNAQLQTLVCASGCFVILNGGLLNQFNVTIGPSFRF